MPTNVAQEELYTVLENMSGAERTFGYLGPRGMRLGASEVVAIPGDLLASLGGLNQSGGRRRKFDALERSLKNGSIRINSRPTPVYYDAIDEVPKSLAIQGGVLGVVDPTYTSSDSASFAAVDS